MTLPVRVAAWELEECGRILHVGDEFSSWLTFHEAEEASSYAVDVQVVEGTAHRLPSWPGGRNPVQLDVGGAILYWDAPQPAEGPVRLVGRISTNNVDAPEGFPETVGVLRRVRMEWNDYLMGPHGSWLTTGEGPRYEEVRASYFPVIEERQPTPGAQADWQRRVRATFDRAVAEGRHDPNDPYFTIYGGPVVEIPEGATETRWTDVLVDLELDDPAPA